MGWYDMELRKPEKRNKLNGGKQLNMVFSTLHACVSQLKLPTRVLNITNIYYNKTY